MKILITGGCGFVGSNLAVLLKKNRSAAQIIVLDNLKRRGSEVNLVRLREHGITFIHGDIRNVEDFGCLGPVDTVIDAAAEPSVLAGLQEGLDYVVNTNLLGTINTLKFAKRCGASLIFLSTSRVYPFRILDQLIFEESTDRFVLNKTQEIPGASDLGITTQFPITGPRSLYGASKLASELLIQEFVEFQGLKAVVNRCGVIAGPWQMGKVDQGVAVLWMARHFWKGELTYNGYGSQGKQVRDLLHIHDLYRLIDWQVSNIDKVGGCTFNVGGGLDCSISLKILTKLCESITGNRISISQSEIERQADVRIYVTDNREVTRATGWRPDFTPEMIMNDIFCWIRDNQMTLKPIIG